MQRACQQALRAKRLLTRSGYANYAVRSRLCSLSYATRLSTGASREAPVDNEWLCKLGYAIDAVQSRLCKLGNAARLSTGASRDAPVEAPADNE